MTNRSSTAITLTVLSYIVVTFAVQGVSHFVVNADHYAGVAIMRQEPIVALGVGSMVIQGALFALLFPLFHRSGAALRQGVLFSWALGAFLASYIALAEAGKYAVPDIGSWIGVEAGVAFVQYTLFGLLLGVIHGRVRAPSVVPRAA